jgi:hypothetical protein
VAIGIDVPFDYQYPMELQLRSARGYAASLPYPYLLWSGRDSLRPLQSQLTAKLAREHGLDVQAIAADGGHNNAVEAEKQMTIDFFTQRKHE